MAQPDGSIVPSQGDPDVPPTLSVGAVIGGKYRIKRVLGSGGNASVYEGEHTEVGHRVAIKVAHRKRDDRGDVLERFRREAKNGGSLRHPHVGQVFDVGTVDDGAPFMVMELQEGRSLSDVIDETQMPFAAIIDITRQLLAGLSAAHQARTVHLDVKPDNVMLVRDHGGDLVVKLVDFGISKRLGETENMPSSDDDGFVVGSPDYMPPEQLRGETVDVRTDLYAVGVLLYEAIAHRPPFDGATTEALVDAVLEAPVPPLTGLREDCPPELERVVLKAISRAPEDRFQSADEMSRALAGLRITARSASATGGLPRIVDAAPARPVRTPSPARARTDTAIRRRRTVDQHTLQTMRLGARKSVVEHHRTEQRNLKLIIGGVVLCVALLLGVLVTSRNASSGITVSAATPSTPASAPLEAPPSAADAPPAPAVAAAVVTPAPVRAPVAPTAAPSEPAPAAVEKAEPQSHASRPRSSPSRTERSAPARKPEPPKPAAAPPKPAPPPDQDTALTRAQLKEAAATFKRGQIPQALALYRQLVKVAPGNADAWRGLAVTANRNAERGEAERALRRYLQLRPGAKDASKILQRVGGGP